MAIFAWPCVLSDYPLPSGALVVITSPREGLDAITCCSWQNCEKGASTENQGADVKYLG